MADILERSFIPGAGAISFGSHRYEASLGHVVPDFATGRLHRAGQALLGIALGDPDVEGARLEACVEWISARVERCAVAIGDTLYRLTLASLHGVDEEEACERALEAGRVFTATYAPLFRQYSDRCTFQFVPLSSLSHHPDYAAHHAALAGMADEDSGMRDAIAAIAPRWIGTPEPRAAAALPAADAALRIAKKYLVEEGAALAVLASQGWRVLVQPGSVERLTGMGETGNPHLPLPLRDLGFASLRLTRRGLFFADGTDKVIRGSTSETAPLGLGTGEFLAGFDDHAWNWLLRGMTASVHREGETIIAAAESDRRLCLLVEGRAEVAVRRPDGTHQQIAILEPGTVMGEQSFVDGSPRSAQVTALTACTVRSLTARQFGKLKVDDPHLALEVITDLARIISLRSRRVLFELQHLP